MNEYEAVKAWWNALTPVERLDAMEPLGSGATTQQAYRYHLLAASHARLLELCRDVIAECGDTFYHPEEDMSSDWKKLYAELKAGVVAAEALGESP